MIAALDYYGKRLIAWPLALAGLLLCFAADACIYSAAWICDVDTENDEEYL